MKLLHASRGILCVGLLGSWLVAQDPSLPAVPAAKADPNALRTAQQRLSTATREVEELRRKLSQNNQEVLAVQLMIADLERQMNDLRARRGLMEQQITDILCSKPEFKAAYERRQAAEKLCEELKQEDLARKKEDLARKKAAKGGGAPPAPPPKKDLRTVPSVPLNPTGPPPAVP